MHLYSLQEAAWAVVLAALGIGALVGIIILARDFLPTLLDGMNRLWPSRNHQCKQMVYRLGRTRIMLVFSCFAVDGHYAELVRDSYLGLEEGTPLKTGVGVPHTDDNLGFILAQTIGKLAGLTGELKIVGIERIGGMQQPTYQVALGYFPHNYQGNRFRLWEKDPFTAPPSARWTWEKTPNWPAGDMVGLLPTNDGKPAMKKEVCRLDLILLYLILGLLSVPIRLEP